MINTNTKMFLPFFSTNKFVRSLRDCFFFRVVTEKHTWDTVALSLPHHSISAQFLNVFVKIRTFHIRYVILRHIIILLLKSVLCFLTNWQSFAYNVNITFPTTRILFRYLTYFHKKPPIQFRLGNFFISKKHAWKIIKNIIWIGLSRNISSLMSRLFF